MRKIAFLVLFSLSLFSFEDLGTKGYTYEILEKNFLVSLKEGIDELDMEKIKSDINKSIVKQATGEVNLPVCMNDRAITEDDYVVLEEDILTPTGKVYQPKGTKVLAPIETPFDICYVDGSNLITLDNQIRFFDQKTNMKCLYLISGANIMDIHKIYPNRAENFFPVKAKDEKRFNVSCYPTRVHLIGNDRTIIEHSYEKFKN